MGIRSQRRQNTNHHCYVHGRSESHSSTRTRTTSTLAAYDDAEREKLVPPRIAAEDGRVGGQIENVHILRLIKEKKKVSEGSRSQGN